MITWVYARVDLPCGSCRASIAAGSKMVEFRKGDVRLARCAGCAKRIFNEDPPDVITFDGVAVPIPTLKVDAQRRPDFVTARKLAQHNQFAEYRRRQSGETE